SSRRRHTRWPRDWSSDVCSSDLETEHLGRGDPPLADVILQGSSAVVRRRPASVEWRSRAPRVQAEERKGIHPAASLMKARCDERSEERRVGKEWRALRASDYERE